MSEPALFCSDLNLSNCPLPRNAPRVLLPACNRMRGSHPFHMVGRKYVEAVRLAGCSPVIVPAAHPDELLDWLDMADGVLLTGSPSNVNPGHFGQTVHDPSLPLDPLRDQWTLPLIRLVLARGLPLLGICRGFQEVNTAMGGSLHQAVHEQPGLADHRGPSDEFPLEQQYGPFHPVHLSAGGLLAQVLQAEQVMVNSLHGQGVARLAPGARVEATAPDGLVEAFSFPEWPGFNLAVQWHPEWQATDNPVSMAIFRAFGMACRSWRAPEHTPNRREVCTG
ncbi:gamma-glutamyl-gamma-aminobutyrate hydrolase family protein [Aquabacterium sp. G14]|uniref:gamma-glutamyl-gamma-aminobutyrate hydrolase family protein n=1 Tax=Aquabacterium sp. G14 TaxID=3130164 RepID=UPI0030B4569F